MTCFWGLTGRPTSGLIEPKMTDNEHERAIEKVAQYWQRELKKSEAKLFFWKMTAIFGIGLLLLSVLELRGCFPHAPYEQSQPDMLP